ncbi:MAG: HAMP domain-containing protein [Lachnospiraceae bacterium]|nr:HAMP domain-containing protein [Lachnospiraceae bacterium]
MKRSIRVRYTVMFVGLMSLMVLIICLANTLYLEKYYISEKTKGMIQSYENVNEILREGDLEEENTYLELWRMFENANISALVGQPSQGKVYQFGYEDRMQQQMMQLVLGQTDERARLIEETDRYVIYQLFDLKLQTSYILCFGFLDDGASCFLRSSLPGIRDSALISTQFTWMIGTTVILIGMVLVYFISGHISRPIVQLAHIADRMSHLDFSARYEEKREDEINLLGTSMNEMAHGLEHTIQSLQQANARLQRDIEEKVKVDEMRKEFISNVSHELKTPIALIQGYAEGLLEGIGEDPESRQYYCEVIADEADKMNQLVRKLLTLNQIESGINAVEPMEFDLTDMIRSVLHSFDIMLKQKNVTVEFDEEKQVIVCADEFMMEEVVRNYISNAIHHVDGERRLDILVEETVREVKVSVFNTGRPIPEADLEHVWQKFYKVDKARTREYGGSGIGLSIVKAVMDSHGGTCGVYNTEEGVCFWFVLNKPALPAVIHER